MLPPKAAAVLAEQQETLEWAEKAFMYRDRIVKLERERERRREFVSAVLAGSVPRASVLLRLNDPTLTNTPAAFEEMTPTQAMKISQALVAELKPRIADSRDQLKKCLRELSTRVSALALPEVAFLLQDFAPDDDESSTTSAA